MEFNYYYIIHGVVCILGVYIIISAFKMLSNKISNWMLRHVALTSKSDVSGFCKAMFRRTLGVGIMFVVFGAYNILAMIYTSLPNNVMVDATFLLLTFAYFFNLAGAKNKYIGQMN